MAEAPPKASPAFAGGRLKYADPRSLPSFPSSGLRPDGAAAGAAASLGWSNQKPVEFWKPEKTSTASSTAALLATDYKMARKWEPSQNDAGAKAAILAVGSASAALKHSDSTSKAKGSGLISQETWGNSAASQAFHASRASSGRQNDLSPGNSAATQAFHTGHKHAAGEHRAPITPDPQGGRSLAAAQGAMNRPRASSTPSVPAVTDARRDEAKNALSGAAIAHRASMKARPSAGNAGAVPVTTMTRNMFTSHPAVKPETDEQDTNERLHQSALTMAKQMYARQQRMVDQAKDANGRTAGAAGASPYLNLQDAAYKQAQERLAKLHNDHQKHREYQEYYGNTLSPHRRFSVGAKLRRRNSDEDMIDDREESEKIRREMSMFSDKLSKVDQEKRQHDREAVLAAAQRNVKARLQGMDERAYNESGKVPRSKLSDWEVKAQQTAQIRHESRTVNKGKIDIGGGRFMDPDEIDAIATRRVQPVLDDINDKAEVERERQAALKLEEETRKEEEARTRARDKEVAGINAQLKAEEKQKEKARKEQEKQEEKANREAQRAARAEEKRLAKEEKRRSKHGGPAQEVVEHREESADHHEPVPADDEGTHEAVAPVAESSVSGMNPDEAQTEQRKASDGGSSPTSKVKGWIKNRFSRGKSVSEGGEKRKSFFGGAALRDSEANGSSASLENRQSSMRDIAMAGKNEGDQSQIEANKTEDNDAQRDSRGISPVSSAEDLYGGPAGGEPSDDIKPPRPFKDCTARTSISPNRDSRFREMMDQ